MTTILSHAPQNYTCPFCLGVQGVESDDTLIRSTDIIYQDDLVTAFIKPTFTEKNPGQVLVVPNKHYETIYTLPTEEGHRVFDVTKDIALAMKEAYRCDGITIRQNNEPASNQQVFHYHLHIFPRYENDDYNSTQPPKKHLAKPEERAEYAKKLKDAL